MTDLNNPGTTFKFEEKLGMLYCWLPDRQCYFFICKSPRLRWLKSCTDEDIDVPNFISRAEAIQLCPEAFAGVELLPESRIENLCERNLIVT